MAEKLISYSGAALPADLSQPEAHGTLTAGLFHLEKEVAEAAGFIKK